MVSKTDRDFHRGMVFDEVAREAIKALTPSEKAAFKGTEIKRPVERIHVETERLVDDFRFMLVGWYLSLAVGRVVPLGLMMPGDLFEDLVKHGLLQMAPTEIGKRIQWGCRNEGKLVLPGEGA